MNIKSFRIRKYRNVEDSGEIELLDKLTCIVGKNQSGKSALLKALHKFNPHKAEPYDMRREWPRGQRTVRDPKQIVCEVRFALDTVDLEHLAKLTAQTMTATEVLITKDYEGNFEINFPEQPALFPEALHPNDIDKACEALVQPGDAVGDQFRTAARESIEEAKRLAKEGRFSELSALRA